MTSVTIYSPAGGKLFEMNPIYEGCTEKFTLMEEHYIELKFNSAEPIHFPVGSWTGYAKGRFVVTENQSPTYNQDTGGYEYTLKMESYYMAWRLRIVKYKNPDKSIKGLQTTFYYTANLQEQLALLVRLINTEFRYAPREGAHPVEYLAATIDSADAKTVDFSEVKTITYDNTNFIEALNNIAEEWDCEWWVDGRYVHFGQCYDKTTDSVEFEIGKNLVTMEGSRDASNYATRVYAFGGTQNLPKNWNKGDCVFTVEQVFDDGNIIRLDKSLFTSYFDSKYLRTNRHGETFGTFAIQLPEIHLLPYGMTKEDTGQSYTWNETFTSAGASDTLPAGTIYGNNIVNLLKDSSGKVTGESGLSVILTAGIYNSGAFRVKTYINLRKYTTQELVARSEIIEKQCGYGDTQIDYTFSDFTLATETTLYAELYIEVTNTLSKSSTGIVGRKTSWNLFAKSSANTTSAIVNLEFNAGERAEEQLTSSLFLASYDDSLKYGLTQGAMYLRLQAGSTAAVGDTFLVLNAIRSKLPSWWFPANQTEAAVIKAYSEQRLTLPEPYYISIEDETDATTVETVLEYDDIYPRTESAITSVLTRVFDVDDDTSDGIVKETYTHYYIKTDEFTFDNDYLLPNGEQLRIKFTTGALAGLTFDCSYNNSDTPDGQTGYFSIARTEFEGGLYLPSLAQKPEVGNKFILLNWDVDRLEDLNLIEKAQQELVERATREVQETLSIDPTVYECTLFSDVAYGRDAEYITDESEVQTADDSERDVIRQNTPNTENAKSYGVGQRVTLINKAFFESGQRESRVIGYERKLDLPWDSPVYSVGAKPAYSRLAAIEKKTKTIKSK
jgi:hypothetical protein